MKKIIFLTILTAIFMISCKNEEVDLIITSGKIYTVDSNFSIVESFAVKNGKIIDLGNNDYILGKYSSENIIDLKGKFVYPGLNDAHCHFLGYGQSMLHADLSSTESVEDIIKVLQKHHEKYKGDMILGHGWDQNDWPVKEFPDKNILDKYFPDIPVILTRIDGHAVWVNSKAIEISGFTSQTKINGGEIIIKNNEISGIMLDLAADSLKKIIPQPDLEQKKKFLLSAQEKCFEKGLCSVSDAGLEYDEIQLIDSLNKTGELKIRIYAMLAPTNENIEKILKKGIYKTDKLNVRSIKLYADGALGSRGACLISPYSDDEKNYGIMTISQHDADYFCKLAYDNNFQVCTHAIGDSANRFVLNTYSKFLKEKNDKRWRIEHAQVIHKEDFNLFGQYSIIPSVQTTHATSDMYWAPQRLGNERIKYAYAYKDLLAQNNWIPNGSDFPIENINPLFGFYSAISRKDHKNFPENGFQSENALSKQEAMRAMTIWAAKSTFDENEKGSLEKGKYADFIICDKDLMEIADIEIIKQEIFATYISGEKVYESK